MAKKKIKTRSPKKSIFGRALGFLAWLTGIVVSLAVAFGLIDGILNLSRWNVPLGVTEFFGWVVVVTTLLGILLAIIKFSIKKDLEEGFFGKILEFVLWLTGIVVSLAVAFALIGGTLSILFIPFAVTKFFGWVIIVTTLLGVLLSIIKQFE